MSSEICISFERWKNNAPEPDPGEDDAQAVALKIEGDQCAFYGCGFYGAQDTLLDDRGRHFFKNCFIQGSIDFIFGNGRSLYQVKIIQYIHEHSKNDHNQYKFFNRIVLLIQ